MMKELPLKKPIMAHNEKLHVLELREPTYDEIEAIGSRSPCPVTAGSNWIVLLR